MRKKVMTISAMVFTLVFILHLLRIIYSWSFIIGTYALPMWFSVLGLVGTALLAGLNWKFR